MLTESAGRSGLDGSSVSCKTLSVDRREKGGMKSDPYQIDVDGRGQIHTDVLCRLPKEVWQLPSKTVQAFWKPVRSLP